MVKKDLGHRIFINTVMIILCVLCLAPFVMLIAASFTGENTLVSEGYSFFIKDFTLEAYQYLFRDNSIFRAYGITILVTVVGVTCSVLVTTLLAYPLSMNHLPGRRVVMFLVFFTMLFSGGLVPSYMMWTQIFHIKNTIWALIIPNLITNGFTIMIMRTYFATNIPREILESARIDGATELKILFKIVVPMSLPIMATIGLMSGITYWNDWNNSLYYITDSHLNSIQALLNKMLTNAQYLQQTAQYGSVATASAPTTAVRMAVAVLGAVPLMCIYPFFQKYFAKGMTLGAVKG